MKKKNILTYILFGCIVVLVFGRSAVQDENTQKVITIIGTIATSLIIAFYISCFVYYAVENKQISKYLNTDDYDHLIPYLEKKEFTKFKLYADRTDIYQFYLLLSYLAIDNYEKGYEYFDKLKEDMFKYPMTYYWKICVDFSLGKYDNIGINAEEFKRRFKAEKGIDPTNLFTTVDTLTLCSQGKRKEAFEMAQKIDMSKITMPSTKKSLAIVNSYVPEKVSIDTKEGE